ncbi:MAG: cytidine deaminase [Saprospiraceae bacterium]|nr:cytidine deaminase [Saprospiraceae bacterium]
MKRHEIQYHEYLRTQDLPAHEEVLINHAKEALKGSYSPYSKFQVGAAAQLSNGIIVTGFNIENAAYPVCLCAEQTTISAIRTQYPDTQIEAMAISVKSAHHHVDRPATPCGKCRQLLSEQERLNQKKIRLILQGETGPVWVFDSVNDLLPFSFTGEFL